MTDLETMTTRELVTMLHLATATGNGEDDDLMCEAARRLERYAPVRIDPDDESTWPTEGDACDDGFMAKPCVEVWYPESQRWYPVYYELIGSKALATGYTHWRRINNEPPE